MRTPDPGERIELLSIEDKYNTTLSPGDTGTVVAVNTIESELTGRNQRETQIDVDWDNGSSLMLIDAKDNFKIIDK